MKFLCLAYEEEKMLGDLSRSEWDALRGETLAYVEILRKSRRLILTNALQSARTAATVRVRNGTQSVLDGPYAETKEQLGGFFLIEARDMDEACAVAARFPPARVGIIEEMQVGSQSAPDRRFRLILCDELCGPPLPTFFGFHFQFQVSKNKIQQSPFWMLVRFNFLVPETAERMRVGIYIQELFTVAPP